MKKCHRKLRWLLQEPAVRRAAAGGAAESNSAEVLPVELPLHGPFSLNARINVDQVGFAFVNGLGSTWDETGALRVQIGQPFPGLEERQCTVNCCIGVGDKLTRTVVNFRGKGRVSAVKSTAYDPGVDVPFQGGRCCYRRAVHPFWGQPARADNGRVQKRSSRRVQHAAAATSPGVNR
ncbi:unnamed protein product [Ectocarpus sp. 12 AP-2014]